MAEILTENLFLIEFLVAQIEINPNMIPNAHDNAGTCVTVQFLDNTPLNICEEDFTPSSAYDKDKENLKTGKSCLFSLTPGKVQETLNSFDINVDIFKKTNNGDKIQVGTSLVPARNLFNKLIKAYKSSYEPDACPVPPAETLRDYFKINNASGQYIGDINMYVRVSCFGKQIVTRFQMNPKEKSILFKDKAGNSLYKYKKLGQSKGSDSEGADQSCGSNCPAGGNCGSYSGNDAGRGTCCGSPASARTGGTSKTGKSGGCCGSGGGKCG